MGADFSYSLKCYALYPLVALGGGTLAGGQEIDGYLYYPSFICPREAIDRARENNWKTTDLLCASYPKAGTHFLFLVCILIGRRGEFPEKSDLHASGYSAEFTSGPAGNNSRDFAEGPENFPTTPRVCMTHMPFHHLNKYSPNSAGRFVYVMRDPVAALASLRRMMCLLFGPIVSPTLEAFIHFQLFTRKTGWLDHVLGWWQARKNPNVLLLTYEDMVRQPEPAVRSLAAHMGVTLTDAEVAKVVMKMDKKWALENIDPYLYAPKTPFSPPDRDGKSKSAFIVNVDAVEERLSKEQEARIRAEYTRKIRVIMENGAHDPAAADNATDFFEANRVYFSTAVAEAATVAASI